ncbi:Heparan-sulfate 6-O-sulfotransferase 3-B, partial [Bulinus truncatus]
SAKDNLKKFFTFFGLLEYIEESQILFEKTFKGLKFTRKMSCKRYSAATNYAMLSEKHWNSIVERNLLDVKLYQFAKDLFFQRLSQFNIELEPRKYESQVVREGITYSIFTNG